MKLFLLFGNLMDRLFVVAGAFIGSQVPLFMHQYVQRLSGHVEALQKLVDQLTHLASFSHQNLDQYIQKFQASSDADFNRQGEFMMGMISRWKELHLALDNLTQSSFWARPYYFIKDIQLDIARSTLEFFQPGFQLTFEGLCYAGGGMIFGWVLYRMFARCLMILGPLKNSCN